MAENEDKPRLTTCRGGCGQMVEYKFRPWVLCDACRPLRKRERDRRNAEAARRRRGVDEVKGTEAACDRCGAAYTKMVVHGRYCGHCREAVALERARRTSEKKRSTAEGRKALNAWARAAKDARPELRVSAHMKTLIHRSLDGGKAGRSWRSFVPYTLADLMRHLERQFLPGMTWDNRGEWHIDHIVPLASFSYASPDDLEFKAAWALTNLRPLWARDNIQKNAKRTHLI